VSIAVVDTNVVLVANGQHAGVSGACVAACARQLQEIMQRGKLALDDQFRILCEYQHKTQPKKGNRPGDAFVKWALQNRVNVMHVDSVSLQDHDTRGFESFPDDADLVNFDAPDRKFVAVAKRPSGQAANIAGGRFEMAGLVPRAGTAWCHGGVPLQGRYYPLPREEVRRMSTFFRFPHTPHIAWLGKGQPRDDKVLAIDEVKQFLREPVVLEEKVDGANLGLSVGSDGVVRAQNRGEYLVKPYTGQFLRLNAWLACHESALHDALGCNRILFGEWLAATHSVPYDRLPDFFLMFDVYDGSTQRFWSTVRRNALADCLDLDVVRSLATGRFELAELKQKVLESSSAYHQGTCEGIYLRQEDTDWLLARAKLVHPDFVQGIAEHWRSRTLRWNAVGRAA